MDSLISCYGYLHFHRPESYDIIEICEIFQDVFEINLLEEMCLNSLTGLSFR